MISDISRHKSGKLLYFLDSLVKYQSTSTTEFNTDRLPACLTNRKLNLSYLCPLFFLTPRAYTCDTITSIILFDIAVLILLYHNSQQLFLLLVINRSLHCYHHSIITSKKPSKCLSFVINRWFTDLALASMIPSMIPKLLSFCFASEVMLAAS